MCANPWKYKSLLILSHSGCMSECCCPGHTSPATPVCPMGTLSCSCGERWALCVLVIELHQRSHEMDHNQPMDPSWEPPDPGHVTSSLSWDSMPTCIFKKKEDLRNIYYPNRLCNNHPYPLVLLGCNQSSHVQLMVASLLTPFVFLSIKHHFL